MKKEKYTLWVKVAPGRTEFGPGTKWSLLASDPAEILEMLFEPAAEGKTFMLQYDPDGTILQSIEIRNPSDEVDHFKKILANYFKPI